MSTQAYQTQDTSKVIAAEIRGRQDSKRIMAYEYKSTCHEGDTSCFQVLKSLAPHLFVIGVTHEDFRRHPVARPWHPQNTLAGSSRSSQRKTSLSGSGPMKLSKVRGSHRQPWSSCPKWSPVPHSGPRGHVGTRRVWPAT